MFFQLFVKCVLVGSSMSDGGVGFVLEKGKKNDEDNFDESDEIAVFAPFPLRCQCRVHGCDCFTCPDWVR